MAWRLHLANQAIHYLNILDGDQPLLAVWLSRERIAYYNLETGTALDERTYPAPVNENRQSEVWQNYLVELIAPNAAYLPELRLSHFSTYLTDDGRMRLYHTQDHQLYLETDGKEVALELNGADTITDVALDRFLGLSAALDQTGKLHVFQQHIAVGTFEFPELQWTPESRPMLAISRGGSSIYVTDGQRIIITDTSGKTKQLLDTHYFIRQMICSPDGKYLATSDMDTGVIRIYDGKTLTLIFQRFAIDLVAHATQVQLMADLPPMSVAPSALAISDAGVIAFAMSGVVCVTDVSFMDEVPRPQALL